MTNVSDREGGLTMYEASPPSPRDDGNTSLHTLGTLVLRGRRWISLFVILFVAVTLFIQLRKHRSWQSTGTFTPETSRGTSQISNLAAQFGVNVGASSTQANPQFYADLAKSRDILRDVLHARYTLTDEKGTRTADLFTLMDPPGKTPAQREDAALHQLELSVNPTVAIRTGIVTVSASGPTPDVAKGIVDTLLAAINRFNIERRQSQARAEREFLDGRVRETQAQLRAVQDTMQNFLVSNREYLHSTSLVFLHDRLESSINRYERLFESLQQALEQARIDEIRDTPVITILQHPEVPLVPNSRGTVVRLLTAAVLGATLGLIVAIFVGSTSSRSAAADPRVEFNAELKRLLHDLRRGRLLRVAFGAS